MFGTGSDQSHSVAVTAQSASVYHSVEGKGETDPLKLWARTKLCYHTVRTGFPVW